MSKALRRRCGEMLSKLQRDAMLRQGDPVEDLLAFVIAEIGRSASTKLDKTVPLCLYFKDDADREGFIQAMREAKPDMITKKFP